MTEETTMSQFPCGANNKQERINWMSKPRDNSQIKGAQNLVLHSFSGH
jgi:hypothetical protein